MKIDERVAPSELVVGISGNLCYMTYYHKKTQKNPQGVLNSEKSWTDWSANAKNPLIVKNKFLTGFKMNGVNRRYSSQAGNQENQLILHPAFNKSFEISLSRLNEIVQKCDVVNGVFEDEFIITNSRNLVTKSEYEELVKKEDIKDRKQKELDAKQAETRVTGANQVIGEIYLTKSNGVSCYIGKTTVHNKTLYAYIEYWIKSSAKSEFIKSIKNGNGLNYAVFLKSKKTLFKYKDENILNELTHNEIDYFLNKVNNYAK